MTLLFISQPILYVFAFSLLKNFYKNKLKVWLIIFPVLFFTCIVTKYFGYIHFFILFFLFAFLSILTEPNKRIGALLFEVVVPMILVNIVSHFTSLIIPTNAFIDGNEPLLLILTYLYLGLSLILTTIGILILKKILISTKSSKKWINLLGYLISAIDITYYTVAFIFYIPFYFNGDTPFYIFFPIYLFFFFFISASIGILFIVYRNKKLRFEAEKRKLEYTSMVKYSEEVGKQYKELRSFRHDYLNILTSLEGYLKKRDIDALETYYYQNIQPTRDLFNNQWLHLDDLQKIQQDGVRSLFITKLILAQGKDIKTQIEVPEPVFATCPVDIIILVRILGILLDNATEELSTLKEGSLRVALFPLDEDLVIIIQNTTGEDTPPVYHLKEVGYSTKGKNRGLGLSNVDTLLKEVPNLLLETTLQNHYFTQKMTVIGGNK